MVLCCVRSELVANVLSQKGQLNGLIFLWTRSTWMRILNSRRNVLWHSGHVALASLGLAGVRGLGLAGLEDAAGLSLLEAVGLRCLCSDMWAAREAAFVYLENIKPY